MSRNPRTVSADIPGTPARSRARATGACSLLEDAEQPVHGPHLGGQRTARLRQTVGVEYVGDAPVAGEARADVRRQPLDVVLRDHAGPRALERDERADVADRVLLEERRDEHGGDHGVRRTRAAGPGEGAGATRRGSGTIAGVPPSAPDAAPPGAGRRRRAATDLLLLGLLVGFVALRLLLGGGAGEWVVIGVVAAVLFLRPRR